MLARRPEAIVLTGGHHTRATMQMLMNARIPVVEIWDVTGRSAKNHAVGFSNFEVGQAMTRHLIDRDYRMIGFIGPPKHDGFVDFRGEERMAGYMAAMEAAGLPTDLVTRTEGGPVNIRHGAGGLTTILEQHPNLDAIFAVSDLAAAGALLECQRRKIKVPRDLAIAGFGDFEISAQTVPTLTTVRVDSVAIGARAGCIIVDLLKDSDSAVDVSPRSIDLGYEIVERGST